MRSNHNKIENKSYITKEMDPRKFMPMVSFDDINKKEFNRASISFRYFTCQDCVHWDDCPRDIKNYHNLEASISGRWSAPCWCMGTCGYRKFEPNWDLLLEDDDRGEGHSKHHVNGEITF